jgi:anaerobic selenocysteine-containing dehydrogenase
MGLDAPALYEPDEAVLAELLRQVGYAGTFDDLRETGTIFVNGDEPVIAFEDLGFATPSGRIEIASEKAESMGLPRVPVATVDAPPAEGWLRLLSPASEWRLNDSYANDPRLRKRSSPAEIHLHPEDAARFGIAAGQPVSVGNDAGVLTLTAVVSDVVQPGTALSYKGRWPSLEAGGNNLNLLYDGAPNDMGESTAVHGVEVRVAPVG